MYGTIQAADVTRVVCSQDREWVFIDRRSQLPSLYVHGARKHRLNLLATLLRVEGLLDAEVQSELHRIEADEERVRKGKVA